MTLVRTLLKGMPDDVPERTDPRTSNAHQTREKNDDQQNLGQQTLQGIQALQVRINNIAANMAAPAIPPVSVKYALLEVPIFDGRNIPLSHFIEGCEEAQQMLPQEAQENLALIL